MRAAYLDCVSGISGDMSLGACIDAGLNVQDLEEELKKLNLSGWRLSTKKVEKCEISATKFEVHHEEQKKHRHYRDLIKMIEGSRLNENVKENSKKIFTLLGKAESKIHGVPLEEIYFHEVGAIDSIIDIVGFSIALDLLKIDKLFVSEIPFSRGTIKNDHGDYPIPAPATLECLKGFKVYDKNVKGELVTPTGAAIIAALAQQQMPSIKIEKIGIGAGTKDFSHPNILRVIIGEIDAGIQDSVDVIETNIDDSTPEVVGYAKEMLLERGALEAYTLPVHTKKNRTGLLLTTVCDPEKTSELIDFIFKETTTIGIRIQRCRREKLDRKEEKKQTIYGDVRIKYTYRDGKLMNAKPEYEDCKKIAQQTGKSLREVMKELSEL